MTHLAELELVPTPGLTYYKLKNRGMQMASTDISVMLDSDAAPCPGWIEAMVKPFDNAQVQAVAGFTVLGHDNLLSRTMALSWIMKLPSERDLPVKHRKMYANNCAFRPIFSARIDFRISRHLKKLAAFGSAISKSAE